MKTGSALPRFTPRSVAVVVTTACLVLSFQNCTRASFSAEEVGQIFASNGGGNGYDGKLYHEYDMGNQCEDGTYLKAAIWVDETRNAFLTRESCTEIPAIALPAGSYALLANETLIFQERVFTPAPEGTTLPITEMPTQGSSEPTTTPTEFTIEMLGLPMYVCEKSFTATGDGLTKMKVYALKFSEDAFAAIIAELEGVTGGAAWKQKTESVAGLKFGTGTTKTYNYYDYVNKRSMRLSINQSTMVGSVDFSNLTMIDMAGTPGPTGVDYDVTGMTCIDVPGASTAQ